VTLFKSVGRALGLGLVWFHFTVAVRAAEFFLVVGLWLLARTSTIEEWLAVLAHHANNRGFEVLEEVTVTDAPITPTQHADRSAN
jgi:uncharacterized membrane protein